MIIMYIEPFVETIEDTARGPTGTMLGVENCPDFQVPIYTDGII